MIFLTLLKLENKNGKKNLAELATEIVTLTKKISRINNFDYLVSCELIKELVNLEDLLTEVYTNFIQSASPKIIDDELSKLVIVNLENFKKVFENFIEEKARHRGTLLEIVYSLESKEAETQREITPPVVKYRNPDAWIRESTIHSFSNIQVNGSTGS